MTCTADAVVRRAIGQRNDVFFVTVLPEANIREGRERRVQGKRRTRNREEEEEEEEEEERPVAAAAASYTARQRRRWQQPPPRTPHGNNPGAVEFL